MTFLTTLLSLFLSAPAHVEHASARIRAELSRAAIASVREHAHFDEFEALTCGAPLDDGLLSPAPRRLTADLDAVWGPRPMIGDGLGGAR